jgi:ADP-ribose pyrophosphatase YjhB (NUDIX family)
VEDQERPEAACLREFREELGLECRVLMPLGDAAHTYAHGAVRIHPLRVAAEGRVRTALAWGWFRVEEAGRLPIPEANRSLLALLAGSFR